MATEAAPLKLPQLPKNTDQDGLPVMDASHKSQGPRRVSGFAFPPGAMRLTTVSLPVSKRTKEVSALSDYSNHFFKVGSYNTRPLLSASGLDGPGPQTYCPSAKPSETNAPAVSFGQKCWPEKDGGARASWAKPWFNSPHIWYEKVDFHSEKQWPTAQDYKLPPKLGEKNLAARQSPAWTFGRRSGDFTLVKKGVELEPAPNKYEPQRAAPVTNNRSPAYTQQSRTGGSLLWPAPQKTPGPGRYNPRVNYSKPSKPGYSMQGVRNRIDYSKIHLGPFSAFG